MIRVKVYWIGLFAAVFSMGISLSAEALSMEEARQLFEQGNRLYQADDFAGARQAYQGILDAGYESAPLYYNLGNAAFRADDLGRAIWAYLRAERLAPTDPDVRANLAFARARTRDTLAPGDESKLLRALAGVASRWPTSLQARAALVLYWALAGILIVRLLVPGRRRLATAALWVCGALLFVNLTLAGLGRLAHHGDTGIVLAPELAAHGEPHDDGRALFTVHAGTEVRVSRRLGGWIEIALGQDLKGWVPESSIATL